MIRCLIFFALLLTGCGDPAPVVVRTVASVPADLRQPCLGPSFDNIETEGDLSDAIVNQSRALDCANSRIISIDEILTCSENPERCKRKNENG